MTGITPEIIDAINSARSTIYDVLHRHSENPSADLEREQKRLDELAMRLDPQLADDEATAGIGGQKPGVARREEPSG